MSLKDLTRLVGATQPVADLALNSRSACVAGLLRAARPVVFAALADASVQPVLVVTAHAQEAQVLADELAQLSTRRVLYFPAIESLPYERVRLDRDVLAQREAALSALRDGPAPVLVAPARALLQPVDAAVEQQPGIHLRAGDRINVEDVLQTWIDLGYSGTQLVEQPGTFARRGGVVDIFPAVSDYPARLELFGSDIESIRTFDPVTQRSTGPLQEVAVPAIALVDADTRLRALESLIDLDLSTMKAEAKTRWQDDLVRLEAGAPVDELSVFIPYLVRSPASLAEIMDRRGTVLVDGASDVWRTLEALEEQSANEQSDLVETGDLPSGLAPALRGVADVVAAIRQRTCIEWETGSSTRHDVADWSGAFVPARSVAGRLNLLAAGTGSKSGNRTAICTLQADRVREVLVSEGATIAADLDGEDGRFHVVSGTLTEGWSLPAARLSLLTDHELFGRSHVRAQPRKARPAREAFFADFSPGDYVVHLEHGVGRYETTVRMQVEGSEREYALVQYAGTDRLYVPSDQLERLTRYIGVADAAPTLNKLGGGEWGRTRQRAERAAEEIAGELIDIYSKRASRPGHAFDPDSPWQNELESSFPYEETPDQARAVEDVKSDMESPRPMDRLLCADVGYGKTEVAVRAAFKAVMGGRQAAILVPTTILAQQHYETLCDRYSGFPIRVEALSRFRSPAQQRDILQRLATGEIDVLVGTHRLLGKDVKFKSLGLLIIDEEQRFGVKHKEQLKRLRESMDVLTLTATPIPRTLHMGLVGIREISVIETPPEGRLPVKTYLQPFDERLVREAIVREMDRDGQVYFVHNKVSTIEAIAERVRQLVPDARVLVGHGQMDESQLERVMLDFAHREADVLISSTIIENGLDIPNVNTIVVNGAHRLGLTQLYQLRGRVGRSDNQAYAYLLYPLDAHLSHDAMRRMEAVFEAQELGAGFSIAMRDLEIRGAGNLLGAEQSGHAAAIGFDLYTRMISDAVERIQGKSVEEPVTVSLDLPLRMFLPPTFIANEHERLMYYRRLAAVGSRPDLDALADELRDRFGTLPPEVDHLLASVAVKLLAAAARVASVSLTNEALTLRADASALYDRVSLYRRYGMSAKVSTNVLRIPRSSISADWMEELEAVLRDMIRLRETVERRPVPA